MPDQERTARAKQYRRVSQTALLVGQRIDIKTQGNEEYYVHDVVNQQQRHPIPTSYNRTHLFEVSQRPSQVVGFAERSVQEDQLWDKAEQAKPKEQRKGRVGRQEGRKESKR